MKSVFLIMFPNCRDEMTTNKIKMSFLKLSPKLFKAASLRNKKKEKKTSNSIHHRYPRLPVSGCVSLWCRARSCHWIFHWLALRWPRRPQNRGWWRGKPPRLSGPDWHSQRTSPCAGGGRSAATSWKTAWSRRCCSEWGSATGRSRSTPSRGRWPHSPLVLKWQDRETWTLLLRITNWNQLHLTGCNHKYLSIYLRVLKGLEMYNISTLKV